MTALKIVKWVVLGCGHEIDLTASEAKHVEKCLTYVCPKCLRLTEKVSESTHPIKSIREA